MSISYHERLSRGTPDFPLELYITNSSHPRYKMQMHWHKEFEIIRVIKGSLHLKLNEKEFNLEEKQSVFIPGGIIHSAEPVNCIYECLVFSPSVLYGVQVCRTLIKMHMQKAEIFTNNRCIERMFDSMKAKRQGFELEVTGCLYLLAADIVGNDSGVSVLPNEKLEKIKAAMLMIEEKSENKQ